MNKCCKTCANSYLNNKSGQKCKIASTCIEGDNWTPEYPKKSNFMEAVEWMDTNKDREYRALSPYGSEVFRHHSGFSTLDSGNNPIKYYITIGDIKGTWKLLQPKEEEGKDVYKEFAELLGKWCEQMQEFNEKIQNKR